MHARGRLWGSAEKLNVRLHHSIRLRANVCLICVRAAFLAEGTQFGFVARQGKAGLCHFVCQLPAEGRVAQFGDGAALGADDKQVVGLPARIQTRSPGIDRIKPVDQTLVNQEIESAVNGGRRCTGLYVTYEFEQFVRLYTSMLGEQYLEHFAPYGSKPLAALVAKQFGRVQLARDVVRRE